MSQEKRFSDEFLNAFVDNQIAAKEKSRAYVEIQQDEGLNRQVCELRKLHDLVQLAYRDPPAPPVHAVSGPVSGRARLRFGVAASFLLALGIVLGSQLGIPEPAITPQAIHSPGTVAPQAVTTASPRQLSVRTIPGKAVVAADRVAPPRALAAARSPRPTARPAPAAVAVVPDLPVTAAPRSINEIHIGNVRTKVLIHIANDDPARLNQAMDDIEGVMRHYRDTGASAHVEVVINGRGLELVRIDTSKHAAEIARLLKEYDNLTFAACQNTIDRLKNEQGITARLLPGVVVTDSGMAEITRRQHQGWTYLQV